MLSAGNPKLELTGFSWAPFDVLLGRRQPPETPFWCDSRSSRVMAENKKIRSASLGDLPEVYNPGIHPCKTFLFTSFTYFLYLIHLQIQFSHQTCPMSLSQS